MQVVLYNSRSAIVSFPGTGFISVVRATGHRVESRPWKRALARCRARGFRIYTALARVFFFFFSFYYSHLSRVRETYSTRFSLYSIARVQADCNTWALDIILQRSRINKGAKREIHRLPECANIQSSCPFVILSESFHGIF